MAERIIPFPRNPRTILAEREHAEKVAEWQEHVGMHEVAARTWLRVAELRREETASLERALSASVRRERMRGVMRRVGKMTRSGQ